VYRRWKKREQEAGFPRWQEAILGDPGTASWGDGIFMG